MQHSTKWVVSVAVVAVALMAALSVSQEQDIEHIMQRKLDHAHSILEALIMEDYETLEDSAIALQKLSEDAGWFVLQTPEYTQAKRRLPLCRHGDRGVREGAESRGRDAGLRRHDVEVRAVPRASPRPPDGRGI